MQDTSCLPKVQGQWKTYPTRKAALERIKRENVIGLAMFGAIPCSLSVSFAIPCYTMALDRVRLLVGHMFISS